MADNTVLNTGTGGDTIATDDIGGVKYQRVKVTHGADGSSTDTSAAAPLPVDASGNAVPVTDNGGSLTVDGTVTANTGTGYPTVYTVDAIAPSGADGLLTLVEHDAVLTTVAEADGDWIHLRGNSRGALWVEIDDSSHVNVTANACTGNSNHDAVDGGNPVKIGFKAKAQDATDPGSVAENDRTDGYADLNGRQYVNVAHPNLWSDNNNYSSAQTNTSIVAAPGASLSLYITDITFSADTAGNIKLVEDPAGTPADVYGPIYIAANGGISRQLTNPIKLSANTALGVTSVNSGNHSVIVQGYIAP